MDTILKQKKKQQDGSHIEYRESELLLFSANEMYQLIVDVEHYPDFLPGWLSVKILSKDDDHILAQQKIGLAFFNWEFRSRVVLDKPEHIQVTSQDSPFRRLNIDWFILPITTGLSRVTLNVDAEIDLGVRPVWRMFVKQSVHSLLGHFKSRAQKIYR